MSRICIIGDSHIGSLLEAGIIERLEGEHSLTFFAAHVDYFSYLNRRGRQFVSSSEVLSERLAAHSGGLTVIDIDSFDEFIVIGLQFWSGLIINTYYDFLPDALVETSACDQGDKYVLSDDAFAVACREMLIATEAGRIAREIRAVIARPVTIVPVPNLGVGLDPSHYPPGYPPIVAVAESGLGPFYAGAFVKAQAEIAAALKVRVMPLPPEAAHDALFNHFEYSLLAEMPSDATPDEKLNAVVHASRPYGDLLIASLFGR